MKKRILMIGMGANTGGVESYIINLIRNVDREKYQFYFLYRGKIAYEKEVIDLGVELIPVDASRHNPIKYIKTFNEIFKKYKFDVVYYNTCDIKSMDMIMFGKKYGVPVRIIHSHNSYHIVPPKLLHKFTEKWCRNNLDNYATKLLACSDIAGDWMFEKHNYNVINNGIKTEKFTFDVTIRDEKREYLDIKEKYVVGFIGRLEEQKNPLFLIDVFAQLYKKRNDAILLVVGDGSMKDKMIEHASKYDVLNAVKFMGVCSNINELMNVMDCFLLPSLFEGLPFVLVEAQTNGLPCVVSTNVSSESNINGEVKFISLDESSEYWANEVASVKSNFDRSKYVDIMKRKQFDIGDTIKIVEQYLDGIQEVEYGTEIYKENKK